MRIKSTKVISILLVLMMIFLSACSGSKSSDSSSSPSSVSSTLSSASSTPSSNKELYMIKVFSSSALTKVIKKFSDTPVGKIVKDKFNIDFEFVPAPAGSDSKQNLNLMLAAAEYPEIIDTECECQDTFKKYVQAGAALKLDPYLKDMPNFTKLYKDNMKYWRQAAGDGGLYNWNIGIPKDLKTFLEADDILVRTDALKDAGYPRLLAAQQYIDFLTKALKDHPTTNGKKTIGMVAPLGESWGMAGIVPIMYEKADFIQVANGAVIWDPIKEQFSDMFTNPYTKESFAFFNKLYRAGVLDPESLTDKVPQIEEKINSGRALSAWYTVWYQSSVNPALNTAGHPELEYVTLPIQSDSQVKNGSKRYINLQLDNPFALVMLTKKAKDPKRILELVDWASSDEGQTLLQSGIEGVQYKIVNGKRVPTDDYLNGINTDKEYKIKQGIGIVKFLGLAETSSSIDGQPYKMEAFPEVKDRLITAKEKETYAALGWKSSQDWWLTNAKAVHVGLAGGIAVDPASEFGTLEQKLTDFRVKNTAKLILSKSDAGFEQVYSDLLTQYKALNPQKVVDKYNELYASGKADLEKLK
jgi:putative aldouronate transport system substrate-binding protein